jgi:tetraprenyl-beta-curcumene synthase
MTASATAGQKKLAAAFLQAASRYWLSVFPRICHESHHWHERAQQIPDPLLRELALEAQQIKRGNIEGSAAFAAFAPAAHRRETVRAQVAFQSAYDYVDTLAEQPHADPVANGHQLHQALLAAIDQNTGHPDYYALCSHNNDAGYLEQIIDTCRSALNTLPSRASITIPAHKLAKRIVSYQSLNLSEPQGGHHLLERWALTETPRATSLRWWETAASAGSSLGLFALIAAAAHPSLYPTEAIAIEDAYWPWIGALHSLLDSLIDESEDTAVAQHSLLHYYNTPHETASRLQVLSREALNAARSLPNPHAHTLILAGMTSFYLTAPEASTPTAQLVSQRVTKTLGPITKPSMTLFKARRAAGRRAAIVAKRRSSNTPMQGQNPSFAGVSRSEPVGRPGDCRTGSRSFSRDATAPETPSP